MTTVTTVANSLFARGDYVTWIAPYRGLKRITSVRGCTMTIRAAHEWRAIEWLHARAEDWLLWPLSDLQSRFTVRAN